jgi:hypothetical protein
MKSTILISLLILTCAFTAPLPAAAVTFQQAKMATRRALSSRETNLRVPSRSVSDVNARAQAGTSFGAIAGVVKYPSDYLPPMRIYAIATDGASHYRTNTRSNQSRFIIPDVPPGRYYVVAYTDESPGMAGAWSRAVPCGLKVTCTNHSLIPVTVISGITAGGVDVGDWYARAGAFPAEPSTERAATISSDIRSIDFRNFSYGEGSEHVVLRDGKEAGAGAEGSRLLGVKYVDLNGDGRVEALVTLATGTRGAQGYAEEYFVYADRSGRVRQVFHESRQKPQQMRVNAGSIVIVAPFWKGTDPGCCPSSIETVVYRWRGAGLVRVSRRLRPAH